MHGVLALALYFFGWDALSTGGIVLLFIGYAVLVFGLMCMQDWLRMRRE